MNLIKDAQTNLVLWYGTDLPYISNGSYRISIANLGIAADSAVLVEDVPAIEPFYYGAYSYTDQGWVVTDQQIIDGAIAGAKAECNAKQRELRLKTYEQESDPLFFKAQRGEATMQEWQDKVAEIKARFLYQE